MSTYANTSRLAHHFDDMEQQYTAAELGMWVFLATEVLFFGGMFAAYAVYRYWYPNAFIEGSHHLDVPLGTLNTAILLTSSLTMALAVHAAQTGQSRTIIRNLLFTVTLGSAFLGIKGYEYHHKYVEGLIPGKDFAPVHRDVSSDQKNSSLLPQSPVAHDRNGPLELFFSLYFLMTGLHAFHMVIGIAILCILTVAASRESFSASYFTPVELTGLYWHFVDIVWVFLFPLLYLVR